MRFANFRSGWAITMAAAVAAILLAQPATAQTPPPATATQPTTLTPAQQAAALADQQVQMLQASWLTEMARSLWQPTMTSQRLYLLNRQVVLLRAASTVFEGDSNSNMELAQTAEVASGAYGQLARQLQDSADRLEAQAKTAPAEQQRQLTESADHLRQSAEQAEKRHGELRAIMRESLTRYVAQRPEDVQAWQSLLRLQMEALQTAGERVAFLSARLDMLPTTAPETPGPPQLPGVNERRSALLDFLGQLAAAQGEDAKAFEYFNRSIAALPLNRGAKQARLQMLQARNQAKPVDFLDLELTGFRINPTDLLAAEAIARLLGRYGIYDLPAPAGRAATAAGAASESTFSRGALGWLDYLATVYQHLNRDPVTQEPPPLPSDFLILRGQMLLLAGKDDEAAKAAREAIAKSEKGSLLAGANDAGAPLPAIDIQARLLLVEALQAANDKPAADAEIKTVVDYYQGHRSKPSFSADSTLAAWLSWFYLRVVNDPKTATELGRLAYKAKASPANAMPLGAALAVGDKASADEAVKLLDPLAKEGDEWSMFYLAKADQTLKSDAKADELLKALATDWPGTPAGRAARAELKDKAPAPPATQPMVDMLEQLPPGLFNFYRTPGRYATIDVQLAFGSTPFDSVTLAIRLSNQTALNGGQGFPITVGENLMVWPYVLVSAAVQLPGEQKPRVFANYCRLHIGSPQVLQPGEFVVVAGAIDVGPLQQLLRMTPQAEKTVTFSLLFNSLPSSASPGQWRAGPGGYALDARFIRSALPTDRTAMTGLTDAATRGAVGARLIADRMIGNLLVEQQLAKQLPYAVRSISTFELSDLLIRATTDADPRVRAFVPDAVYPAGVSGKLLDAVDNGLSDRDWLVRLMTVRLLGDRMGRTYAKSIRDLAGKDEHPLVRDLAQTYVDQWDTEEGKR
jgi:hypothetical protein